MHDFICDSGHQGLWIILSKRELTNRGWAIIAIVILSVSGASGLLIGSLFRPSANSGTQGTYEPIAVPTVERQFGNYTEFKTNYTLNATPYTVEPDLSNIINPGDFPLTDEMKEAIADHYFVADRTGLPMFSDIYEWNYENEKPSFVTSDSILHAYHVLYDLTLRSVETDYFLSDLYDLSRHLVETSLQQYNELTDPQWRDLAKKNVAYFSVACRLLNSSWEIPSVVAAEVNRVLYLIGSKSGFNDQWFMNQMIDWTQFAPRGHYTRTVQLQQYFKALMWLSRVAFRLEPQDFEPADNPLNRERGRNETAQAILLCVAMNRQSSIYDGANTHEAMNQWMKIYDITSFFVGTSDDLTPYEYQTIIDAVYRDTYNYTELTDSDRLGVFIATAKNYRRPQILSGFLEDYKDINATMGLRFMGQRYVPDSYMFCELTHKQVPYRFVPKALDIMAVLGSERAWELLQDQTVYTNYTQQMKMLKDEFSNLTMSSWTQNLYWLWLYSFKTLLKKPEAGHPSFMMVPEWIDKQLVTCLGTWTELRHDTILYAKQSYSLYYGLPHPPPGYVEPVPELFARVASLCNLLRNGLIARGMADVSTGTKLEKLQWLSLELKAIAEKELSGIAFNDSDEDLLRHIGFYIADIEGTGVEGGRAALVADVHTDPTNGVVLEEATGEPMYIIVAVPDHEGNIFLARGAMYSHYEFTVSMDNRLTDEMWWTMLDDGTAPSMADWMGSFVLGVGGTSYGQQENLIPANTAPHVSHQVPLVQGFPLLVLNSNPVLETAPYGVECVNRRRP